MDVEGAIKAFKQEMKKELFLEKSPCGAGVEPTECSCEDGSTFAPDFTRGSKPCGESKFSLCTCPNGETFDKETMKEIIKAIREEKGKGK